MNEFIDWLNMQVELRDWSYRKLSKRAGISAATVSDVINLKTRPTWDFCAAIARAFGEPPEKVFRIAGLLPAQPPAVEEEKEAIAILRSLSPELRTVTMNILRSLTPTTQPQPLLAEIPAIYDANFNLEIEIQQLITQYPELVPILTEAREKLSEKSLRALVYNIRIFITATGERASFSELHKQLSDLFAKLAAH